MPFHRLARLQRSVGVPLPASVPWEQAERAIEAMKPAVEHFEYLRAQSALFHNDDTPMRIARVRQEIQTEIDAKRKFIEIRNDFPAECGRVVETFASVYRVEAECQKEQVEPLERLRRHRAKSQPALEAA